MMMIRRILKLLEKKVGGWNGIIPERKVTRRDSALHDTTAKKVRDRFITDAKYAKAIRWQPAFKQLVYRNDSGKLIVTISQNSIGNAITELLGVVVNRTPDAEAYAAREPALISQLLEVRRRLIEADLGVGVGTEYWPKE